MMISQSIIRLIAEDIKMRLVVFSREPLLAALINRCYLRLGGRLQYRRSAEVSCIMELTSNY